MAHLSKIAVVGAAGSTGSRIVAELLKTGKHEVTAITREGSISAAFGPGVKVARVHYDDPSTIISALQGQQALIITLSITAPKDTQAKLIEAAAEANVPYVVPNGWGADPTHQSSTDSFLAEDKLAAHRHIDTLGKSSWIEFVPGYWYDYSLGGTIDRFGFDFDAREVMFYDEGTARLNTSTWAQIGRAVAALFSLDEAVLATYKDKCVYMSSFYLSQQDMFESVLRVTGTKREDWKIRHEDSRRRFEEGLERLKGEDRAGFMKTIYSRGFYPEEGGDTAMAFQKRFELVNEVLRLPQENLDECTKRGIEMRKEFDGIMYRGRKQ